MNELIIPDEFPLPRQDDILQTLTGANWLSTLDALAGFTQLQIKPEDREKTAFRTHRGLYQFRRMPFGYRNGPAIFQRVMQGILSPFLWIFALVYIDDIVIFSKTFDDHLLHLDHVFKAIADSGITLSPKKCNLGYQSLQLLGQKVSRLGLSTVKDKVDAILQLEEPRNIKTLQTFLGMMVYFSLYIPYYAWIVAPLFKLLKKDQAWEWNELHQEAFDLSKEALANSPVRGYAIPGLGYRIYTDACDYGIAAILQQVQPMQLRDLHDTKIYQRLKKAFNNGEAVPRLVVSALKDNTDLPPVDTWAEDFENTTIHLERVIAYWSRTLKPAERNYSPTEREALALKDGMIKFQGFIEGEKAVIAITDHAALTWAKTYQNVNRRLLTWGTVFAAYPNVKIVHRAGRVHSNVDPISRLRRRIPYQEGPAKDVTVPAPLNFEDKPLLAKYTLGRDDQTKGNDWLGIDAEEVGLDTPEELGEANSEDTNINPEFGELIPEFETRVLFVAKHHAQDLNTCLEVGRQIRTTVPVPGGNLGINTNVNVNLVTSIAPDDLTVFTNGYTNDPHFSMVLSAIRNDADTIAPSYPQYSLGDDGLLYFDDALGCSRLCVPAELRLPIITDIHETPGNAAHGGYHKTYNRIAATFYWPRMARDIKRFTRSCDICQKIRPRRHAAYGLLQPIAIPTQPFETVTMDFIMELPESEGFDAVLVIVDKLTKYVQFIPTLSSVNAKQTAELVFKYVVAHFGLPRQFVTDCDARWTGIFWKELCDHLGVRRALTTAHHPQADGQTEIANQLLEITLCAFVGPERDDWARYLDILQLSYNTSIHSSTQFTPAFLLRGFEPLTANFHPRNPEPIQRSTGQRPAEQRSAEQRLTEQRSAEGQSAERRSTEEPSDANEWLELFEAARKEAADSLRLAQAFQQRGYNARRLNVEFDVGDFVLLNPHSLEMLRNVRGRGRKLLIRYDGPFEIIQKISPLAYRLRLPASYGTHPVINIAHLEKFNPSPPELGERSRRRLNRLDFDALPEYEVDSIVDQRRKRERGRRWTTEYLVRFVGYEEPEWIAERDLQNAPDILQAWKKSKR